ncbi:hypothetical protein BD289DRAFT_47054 [Coniella lustricola]|uniref:Uncharacterized protein n=1 Tax=Coniella lustricola TaxID=2025994 RepID=A0A2T3AID2_9PEZI|nr:hypothetical protein BD289DRAFT_47054 [Coniella lustricola]
MTGPKAAAMAAAAQRSSPDAPLAPRLDIRSTPVVIRWVGNGPEAIGASLSSTSATLDIDFDPSCKAACFRFRVALSQRGSNKIVPVYLLVNSQQIKSVAGSAPRPVGIDDAAPDDAVQNLIFSLERPPLFIMPSSGLHPKDKTQSALLASARSAARTRELFVDVRSNLLSQDQLTALCNTAYQDLGASSRLANLASFYGGRGGKVIELTGLFEGLAESPPSYGDIGAPPPLSSASHGATESSSKKRRLESPVDRSWDISHIESICKKICAQQYDELRAELSLSQARIIDSLEQRLDARISTLSKDCQGKLTTLEARVQNVEDEIRKLDDACNSGLTRLEEEIQKVNEDIGWRVDVEVDEHVTGMKIELEDYVKSELKNTEDTLKEKLEEASFSLVFKE